MHPRIAALFTHLDEHRAAVRTALDSVPADRHNAQPAPGRWSVVNVLEHLAMVEGNIAGLFRRKIDEARAGGLGPEPETTVIAVEPLTSRVIDRSSPIQGADAVREASTVDAATAWNRLEETRAQLRDAVLTGDGLALGTLSHPHRAFGPLSLYEWLVFVGAHESRHADQIREIGQS